ncbi:MAG: hypothetical protein K8S99_14255 [Planctomycetes bacterium]|nr:hypothetical protein [Planctomycetota bacterium]
MLLLWLVSINVGSMEHFDFSRKELGIDDFKIKHHDTFGQALFKVKIELASPNSDRILDPGAAQRASLVFIALAQERDESILNEYVKGLYHYGAQLYGIDFWKEAFRLCLKTL